MLYTGIPSGWDPSSCLPIQREARAERLSVWRRSLPPVREDLRRGWGRRPARREEDAAAGDEPCAVSSCYIEDLVCVASRQQHIVAKPPAGDTSTKRGGASVARARERSDGGGRLAGAREGRGGGGGSRIRGMERRRWPEPGEGGARRRRWLEPGEIGGGSGCRRWCRVGVRRILPRPRSTSELVAGDRILRWELVTGGRVRRPRLNPRPRSPRRRCRHHHAGSSAVHAPHWCSAPAPSLSPRRILRRPCDHAPRWSSPVAVSSMPELVAGGRILHAEACRRRRWSSLSVPPASARLRSLLPQWPVLPCLREVKRERSRWDSIPTGYRWDTGI
uniref:Uncharacterized protein n=1 Tax=Oryza rufipogon TaxID=4529 RepID=A0A0E0NNF8_ORYRU